MVRTLCSLSAIVLLLPLFAFAQESANPASPAAPSSEPTVTETKSETASVSSWLEQQKMTGDWGGARTALEEKGIKFDLSITQVLQGNAHGGAQTDNGFRYSGTSELDLTLDTGKMGLWPGGQFVFRADTKWGNGINPKVGSLLPVNLNPYFPTYPEECEMALSEFFYQQVLMEGKVILLAGKLWGARAFDANVFANNEQTQFMNLAFRNVPMIADFLPYTTLGAGVIVNPFDWLSIMTAAADTDGQAIRTGFDTAFHGKANTTVIHEWSFKIKPFNRDGHQRVGFVWSCEDFSNLTPITPFKQTGPLLMKLLGPEVMGKLQPFIPTGQNSDNILVYYNFDQYVIQKEDDPAQGIGVFGRFAWARQDVNAACHFYSIGVGGKGMVPTRPRDQYGVGYYFLDLSNHLPSVFEKEQGVEMYYSFEVTPWFHISPDLQIIMDPGGMRGDTAVVYGLRMQLNL